MIDPDTYRDAIARDVDLLAGACADYDAAVPSCPDWTVRDLVRHLGKVQRWATGCLRTQPGIENVRPRGPGDGVDPRSWLCEGARELLDVMNTVDLTRPVHTWAGQRPGSWWLRRLTHETAIHRWDAETTFGPAGDFVTELAADGIDEFFEEFVSAFADLSVADPDEVSVAFHATDAERDDRWWHVEFDNEQVLVDRIARSADVSVRAPTSELFLLMWHRRSLEGLDVVGDPGVLERWQQVIVV